MSGITVVIPTYGAAAFIEETLRSVFSQSLSPAEVIVVDDASKDATGEVVESLARHAPCPTRLIRRAVGSGGPAVPMNDGVAAARTEWIALLDHDDRMLPQKLERQMQVLHATESNLCFSDFRMLWADGRLSDGLRAERRARFECETPVLKGFVPVSRKVYLQEQVLDPGIVQSCSNLLFHRDLLEYAGPFDVKQSALADYIFKLKIAPIVRAVFVPEVLFDKRCHDHNLFDASDSPKLRRIIRRIGLSAVRANPDLTIRDPEFRSRLQGCLLDMAYKSRLRGHLGESASAYLDAARCTGFSKELILQLVKWPVGAAMDYLDRRRRERQVSTHVT